MPFRPLLLAGLLAAMPAAAQDRWQNEGAPPAPGSQASRDGFAIMALVAGRL